MKIGELVHFAQVPPQNLEVMLVVPDTTSVYPARNYYYQKVVTLYREEGNGVVTERTVLTTDVRYWGRKGWKVKRGTRRMALLLQ